MTRSRTTRPGDPQAARPLARLHIVPGDQGEQRDRLGVLAAQLQILDRRQHPQRVVEQAGDQRLALLWVVPVAGGLAGRS